MLTCALVLFFACAGDGEDSGDPGASPGWESTPYEPDLEDAGATPQLTASDVEAALDEVVPRLRDFHAGAVVDTYEEVMALGSGGCPDVTSFEGTVYWGESCSTGAGVTFTGEGELTTFEDEYLDLPSFVWDGRDLYVEATMTTSQGTWDGAGVAWQRYGEPTAQGAFPTWTSRIAGTFSYEGSDTWLGGSLRPHLDLSITLDQLDQAREATINGGVTGLESAAEAAWFHEVLSLEASSCPEEPEGTLLVRDTAGGWYELAFDDTCDGCGAVLFDGTDIGEACIDIGPLHAWDTAPW